ncbi:CBO0543 family protein [Paenibacillus cremeus]|uniref:CBO0543 family protein n=1 Tax=Paenibacillus cremeus TaxID=2163881 RepID=UPI0037046958
MEIILKISWAKRGDNVASPSFDEVNEMRKKFLDSYHEYWLENAFLTWQWWLLLITVICSWVVWWKVVDKRRIHLILNFGFLYGIISLILDMVGMNHLLWAYPIRLYWAFIPPLLPFDLSYLPIIFMLVYQRYGRKSTTKVLIAFTITSAIISFVVEPFFHWIGIYEMYKWKYIYSFPIYITLAFLVRFLVGIFERKQKVHE